MKKLITALLFLLLLLPVTIIHAEEVTAAESKKPQQTPEQIAAAEKSVEEAKTAQEKLAGQIVRLEKVFAVRGIMEHQKEHQKKIELVQMLDELYGKPEIRAAIEQATGRTINWSNFDPLDNLKSLGKWGPSNDLCKIDTEGYVSNISIFKEALADGSTIKPFIDDSGNLLGWDITFKDGTGLSTWANSGLRPDNTFRCDQAGSESPGNHLKDK